MLTQPFAPLSNTTQPSRRRVQCMCTRIVCMMAPSLGDRHPNSLAVGQCRLRGTSACPGPSGIHIVAHFTPVPTFPSSPIPFRCEVAPCPSSCPYSIFCCTRLLFWDLAHNPLTSSRQGYVYQGPLHSKFYSRATTALPSISGPSMRMSLRSRCPVSVSLRTQRIAAVRSV